MMALTNSKQSGMATMMISVVLLTSIGLMSVYSAQVGVMEQKISANHYRSTQAFEAAQAGMDNVVQSVDAQIVNAITQQNVDEFAAFSQYGKTLTSLSQGGSQSLGRYELTLAQNAGDSNLVEVTLMGYAGDNSEPGAIPNQIIRQRLFRTPMLTAPPPAPLIARGSITIDGDVSVANKEKDSLISSWSGGATAIGTATIDVTSSDGQTDGGYSQNHAALANLDNDGMFENFFSETRARLKNRSKIVDCVGGCDQTNLSTLVKTNGTPKGSNIIWVDAKTEPLDPNNPATYDKLVIGSNFNMGTAANPVILIVDGKLEIADDADFYGVIYTTQDFNNGINVSNITGSLITEGNIVATGGLNATYQNAVFNNMNTNIARYVRVAGSWRDF